MSTMSRNNKNKGCGFWKWLRRCLNKIGSCIRSCFAAVGEWGKSRESGSCHKSTVLHTDQQRKGKEEGFDGTTDIAMGKDKPQPGKDEQWTMVKCCNGLQKEKLSVHQESHGLWSEHKEMNANFYELQREQGAVLENLNAVQRVEDKSVSLEDTPKMMLNEKSDVQKSYLLLTQIRDTLKLLQEEMNVNFEEVKRKYSDNSGVIKAKCDDLQRDRDKLTGMEDKLKMILNEESHVQKAYLLLTQERDTLKSVQAELKVNFDELQRKCNAMTDNLGVIKTKCDDLLRDRDKLTGMEDKLEMMLNKEPHVQKDYLLLTQERDTLQSDQEKLKVNYDELQRKCNSMTDNLNDMKGKWEALERERNNLAGVKAEREELEVNFYILRREYISLLQFFNALREERDALQRDKNKLVRVECTLQKLLDEKASPQKAYLMLSAAIIGSVSADRLRAEPLVLSHAGV